MYSDPMRRDVLRSALSALSAALVIFSVSSVAGQARPSGLTAVDGIRVGHFTLSEKPTGCTVILAEKGATGGVSVRGSAPGTRETELLDPSNLVEQVHAIVLSGGVNSRGVQASSKRCTRNSSRNTRLCRPLP